MYFLKLLTSTSWSWKPNRSKLLSASKLLCYGVFFFNGVCRVSKKNPHISHHTALHQNNNTAKWSLVQEQWSNAKNIKNSKCFHRRCKHCVEGTFQNLYFLPRSQKVKLFVSQLIHMFLVFQEFTWCCQEVLPSAVSYQWTEGVMQRTDYSCERLYSKRYCLTFSVMNVHLIY